jgi:hypothetical protein
MQLALDIQSTENSGCLDDQTFKITTHKCIACTCQSNKYHSHGILNREWITLTIALPTHKNCGVLRLLFHGAFVKPSRILAHALNEQIGFRHAESESIRSLDDLLALFAELQMAKRLGTRSMPQFVLLTCTATEATDL